ncbi:hypothetical protein OQA88_5657 [Cercophora sp. LCS_1]
MAGLVAYDSSDEDEDVQAQEETRATSKPPTAPTPQLPPPPPPPPPTVPDSAPEQKPIQGPLLGPAAPPPTITEEIDLSFLSQDPSDPPRSPYTAARTLSRDLTLPAVPNMDIPPSPPLNATAAENITALNAKFDTFLKLKRRANDPAHFNARLAASDALCNPSLMDKLLGFVGMETEFEEGDAAATGQYGTTLPTELWDPSGFPEWAYKGALRRSQERENKERERKRGERVDFVSAGEVPVREGRRTMFDT